ncbi:SNARE Ufe1 [Schizosaccharomyces cryophilus OY26]|uniref:SNARE Ufe1 n=1 Tax=Schizosaccharomyces cryophilus (strain OY26 / ATCC MYA-4695 / CBS 11777 / NBRC 106824 / NRRL Y48691) TaxID=653667 RepID=S9WYD2_SCHCR|nr:SNARE Ufe1 [Schizosaccharomyces cryophilus OY26]EPY49742.1 SNARE Ufe1 [Schizosaccharomyces cryophilus OY26]
MTSRTNEFFGFIEKGNVDLENVSLRKPKLSNVQDAFLAEAYLIHNTIVHLCTFLEKIRGAYLKGRTVSNVHKLSRPLMECSFEELSKLELNDLQRDEIDHQASTIINSCVQKISSLQQKLKEKQYQIPKRTGWLQSFKSPEKLTKTETIVAHYSSILWYLQSELSDVSSTLYRLQDLRLRRAQERKTIMSDILHPQQANDMSVAEIPDSELPNYFSQEQLMELEQENDLLLQEFEHTMQQVHETGKSLTEIARLQTEISTQLSAQSTIAEKLYDDAMSVADSITGGNRQLIHAKSRNSRTARIFFFLFTILGLLLLALDRIV